MAASLRQRQKAAEVLRGDGTQEQAANAASVSVSTVKRWLKRPDFLAMVSSSVDIRPGLPASLKATVTPPVSVEGPRSQMWATLNGDGSGEVLGSFIPPAAYGDADAAVHLHVVRAEAVEEVRASIDAGTYPAESHYIPLSLSALAEVVDNLSFLCRLGSEDQHESLMAWLEVWTFVDEDGRTRTLAESLWPGQRRFLEAQLCDGHVISVKARKVGLSTLVCAHAAWTARIRDVNASVHLLSHREDAARELLRGLRTGFEALPAFLRLPSERETTTVLAYAAGPGDTRYLKAFPATQNASIETTCSHLVVDEWAHTFDPEAIWTAVEPTLSARATSALITTARGPGDFVHDYYLRSEAERTRHTPVFVSALERHGRSVAWLEAKRAQDGKWSSRRNYPMSAEEAFASAGDPYFAPELLEAAQADSSPPSRPRRGDRCVKAWDIGHKRSVCVVLRVPAEDEAQALQVIAFKRLVDEEYPSIQREIKKMYREYPGPTIVEANSIGKPVIQNLHLPWGLVEYTTTKVSKHQMLTAIELHLQQRTLKIHPDFKQLLAELAAYRQPDGSIIQDSVMALGIAVINSSVADATWYGGPSVLDLEPFTDEWYDYYEARRLGSREDLLDSNDARRGEIPPAERRARKRAPQRVLMI